MTENKLSMNLPLVLNGQGCYFVFVGGGKVASRKIDNISKTGARVKVVARNISKEIKDLSVIYNIKLEERNVSENETYPAHSFVVLATDNSKVNEQQAKLAKQSGAQVCRTDDQSDNDFIFPAVVDRSPLLVTVSTSGATPALTRYANGDAYPENGHMKVIHRLADIRHPGRHIQPIFRTDISCIQSRQQQSRRP